MAKWQPWVSRASLAIRVLMIRSRSGQNGVAARHHASADDADRQDHQLQSLEPVQKQQGIDQTVEHDLDPERPVDAVDPAGDREQDEGADVEAVMNWLRVERPF
jgi:hypothetical protein